MQLWYGNFAFPQNSCDITRTIAANDNDQGIPLEVVWTFNVNCTIVPLDGQTATQRQLYLSGVENAIRTAVHIPGGDLVLRADDGSPVDLSMYSAGALDRQGVHVVSFSNPNAGRAEYAGSRTVSFAMRATYPVGNPGMLVSFSESMQVVGTGSPYIVNRNSFDKGVRQTTRLQSTCRAVHSGQAVGYLAHPALGGPMGGPRPLFPLADRLPEALMVTKQSPQFRGAIATRFPLSWSYTYERVGIPFLI